MRTALLFLVVFVPLAHSQSTQQETGTVEGKVLSISGEPLSKAALHLRASNGGTNYTVSTNGQGDFLFEGIKPGHYMLAAERRGYLPQMYGNFDPRQGDVRDLGLPPGGHLKNIVLKLTPQASISGRVLDEDGDPFFGGFVTALRIGYAAGRRQALNQSGVASNPDGTFTIWNLSPGRYYVSAFDQRAGNNDEQPAGKAPPLSYLTSYFPNASEQSSATPIVVAAGADVRGIDIRLIRGRKYWIRGKFTGFPDRGVLAGLNFALGSKDQNPRSTAARPDGSFAFPEILPGDYVLQAQTTAGSPRLQAYLSVSVTDRDLELDVPLTPAAEIIGTAKILQSNTPVSMTPPPFVVLSSIESPSTSLYPEDISGTDSFRFGGVLATRFQVGVGNLPPGVLVKSIRFEGQDVTHQPLDLTSGTGGTLEILLSPTAPELTGVVHDENGAVVADATVAIWRPGAAPGEVIPAQIQVLASETGQFQFQNLPPGDYLVGSWPDLEPGLWQVPEFRAEFESSATKVTLEESGHTNIDVKIFSASSVASAMAKLP